MKTACIVSCTAHKRKTASAAEELYASPLFYKSRRYAQAHFDHWFILSAKYGLVEPGTMLVPYDQKLTTLSRAARQQLAALVQKQARGYEKKEKLSFTSICGEEYGSLLRDAEVKFQHSPQFELPIGKKLQALSKATDPEHSEKDLDQVYKVLRRLALKQGLKKLRDTVENPIPQSGVYLFFDQNEHRLRDNTQLRVVRVGTHGVAAGSKASLRNRIRTHLGTSAGDGNHRSSIFRLHVGRSFINASVFGEIEGWGGELSKNKKAQHEERVLEQHVSKYLGDLGVLFVSVPGESSKSNDRAYLEQNLIALFSNSGMPLDPPSYQWLGKQSSKNEIRRSGLWNVNHVYQHYDPSFVDVLEHYVSLTTGDKSHPGSPLAPSDWQRRAKNNNQLSLI